MEREALIAACLAEPLENTPRLLLADWLDEHSTSDQDAARSEWIRLTCSKIRTPAAEKRGFRSEGELAWIMQNWRRLWPNLAQMHSQRVVNPSPVYAFFPGGAVDLRVWCNAVYTSRDGTTKNPSILRVACSRGLTSRVTCPLAYAAQTGPVAAMDEPYAEMRVTNWESLRRTGREFCGMDEGGEREIYSDNAMRDKFSKRGLLGVYELLEDFDKEKSTKTFKYYLETPRVHGHRPCCQATQRAFTRWCRLAARG